MEILIDRGNLLLEGGYCCCFALFLFLAHLFFFSLLSGDYFFWGGEGGGLFGQYHTVVFLASLHRVFSRMSVWDGGGGMGGR